MAARTRLDVPDAELQLFSDLLGTSCAESALATLSSETPWRQERITLWGKSFPQPRLSAWYGDAAAVYAYSGLTLAPLAWTPLLDALRRQVEQAAGTRFNSVLLNYYRDQHDSMGFHSDDEPELGPRPVIASLSLGATRVLVLRHKRRIGLAAVRIALEPGSLLVMSGDTQQCWKHGINKQRAVCGPRLNLTFRRIEQPAR